MSAAAAIAGPGQIVVIRKADNVLFARVSAAHHDRIYAFVWLERNARWERRFSRFAPDAIIAVLPAETAPDLLDRQIRALRNKRNAERLRANRLFEERVRKFLKRRAA